MKQAKLFNALATRFKTSNFSDVNFYIINLRAYINHTRGLNVLRRVAGEIPVYQETEECSEWTNILNGTKLHILVIDRCKRLTYQLINPWSTVSYPYVKAAILSTYVENPCGECIKATTTEASTSSTSTIEPSVLPRYNLWNITETSTMEEAPSVMSMLVDVKNVKHSLEDNINSTVKLPTDSHLIPNETRYNETSAVNYYRYSSFAQQLNTSNVNEMQNNRTGGIDLNSVLQINNKSNSNNSEYFSRMATTETENTDENTDVNKVSFMTTSKLNISTENAPYTIPENIIMPQTLENLSKHEHNQSVTTLLNGSITKEHTYLTDQPPNNFSTKYSTNTSLDETKVRHHKHKTKTHSNKKYSDKESYTTPHHKERVQKHHHINRDYTYSDTNIETTTNENHHTIEPSTKDHSSNSKCEQKLALHSRSSAVHTGSSTVGLEEIRGGRYRNALTAGVDIVRNEIVKISNDKEKAYSQKPKKCHAEPKSKELQKNTTAITLEHSTQTTPSTHNKLFESSGKPIADTGCSKHVGAVDEKGMQTEWVEATEEETIRQYEQLFQWLDYIL